MSQAGDTVNTVALALLVFDLTGSGVGVATVVAAEIVPVLLLAPVAGMVADRLPRRAVLVTADLARAALVASLPFVAVHPAPVYLIAAATAVGMVFFNPAASALVPTVAGANRLVAANSGIWIAAVLAQILLAPTTGLVVGLVGLDVAFWVNATSFVASAALLIRLPAGRTPASDAEARTAGSWWHDAAAGAGHILGDRLLRLLAAGQLLAALSAGATSALLVILISEQLAAPAFGYGIALGAIAVGAATGPLVLLRFVPEPTRPFWVFGPYALRGGVDLVLATSHTLPLAAGALACYGVGTSTGAVTFNSLLQASVPDRLRGRVFATFDITWHSGRLVSLAVGGVLADLVGVQAVYVVGGVLLLAASALGLLTRRATASQTP